MSWLTRKSGLDKNKGLKAALNALLRLFLTPEVEKLRRKFDAYALKEGLSEAEADLVWSMVLRMAEAPEWLD